MWLNLLMDECHFNNIAKIIFSFVPNHIWENKNLEFSKNGHILIMETTLLKTW
jgi:hypothetical protein